MPTELLTVPPAYAEVIARLVAEGWRVVWVTVR